MKDSRPLSTQACDETRKAAAVDDEQVVTQLSDNRCWLAAGNGDEKEVVESAVPDIELLWPLAKCGLLLGGLLEEDIIKGDLAVDDDDACSSCFSFSC